MQRNTIPCIMVHGDMTAHRNEQLNIQFCLTHFFCKHSLVVVVHPLLLGNINMQKMSLLRSCGCVVQRICLSEKRDIMNIWLWFSPIGLHWWCAQLDEEMYLRYIQTKELKQAGCVRKRRPINLNCLGHKKLWLLPNAYTVAYPSATPITRLRHHCLPISLVSSNLARRCWTACTHHGNGQPQMGPEISIQCWYWYFFAL